MKSIFKNILFKSDYKSNSISTALLILRIGISILMLTHGIGKLNMLFGESEIQFADPIGIGEKASLIMAVFAEFFCSILLILGLLTRISAIPLFTTMAVAVFIVHAPDPLQQKEMALLYGIAYLTLIISGAGKFSLDYIFGKMIK
jgi:putative oxidoreductase